MRVRAEKLALGLDGVSPRGDTPDCFRFDRLGMLAIDPKALFELFYKREQRVNAIRGDVEIVDVRGPLDQHDRGWCESYEGILARVNAACAGPAKAIVLRIDSPGGEVAGCFETARAVRAACSAAGKPLYAYVDGRAFSAAYAIASAATKVVLSETAMLGSIGVINTRPDFTAQNAERGVKYALIVSGARKADGNPDSAITEDELRETQALVDSLAGVFFDLVAETRGMTSAAVKAFDARIFHGAAAVKAGLADAVQPFEAMLVSASSENGMKTKYDEARAALEEAAKGDDEQAKKAKKALAALDEEEPPAAESEESADEDEEEAEEEAASEASGSVGASTAAALGAVVNEQGRRLAKLEADRETEARASLLASRPDLDPALVNVLATKPLVEVKAIVAAIRKPKIPKAAAAATVTATRGEGQGSGNAARLPPEEKAKLDARMGLRPMTAGVKEEGNRLILGAAMPTPAATGKDA